MMANALELPALIGTDPLGFLAGLGVFNLVTSSRDPDARLSWSPITGSALVHCAFDSVEALADWLVESALAIPDDAALPGAPPSFPLRAGRSGGDPMRAARSEYRAQMERFETEGANEWAEVLVTDLGVDEEGRARLTPWMAPSGKQTVRTFFEKPLEHIRANPTLLRDALWHWHRIDGYSGEYLDYRAINDAAASSSGKSTELGAPGPTWLAAMALPLLRLSGDGNEATATLWRASQQGPIRRYVCWPLWQAPLDRHAVVTLLEHPDVTADSSPRQRDRLQALGVFRICRARRQPLDGRKSAGVLTPM